MMVGFPLAHSLLLLSWLGTDLYFSYPIIVVVGRRRRGRCG